MNPLVLFGVLYPSALLIEGALLPVFRIPLKGNVIVLLCANFAAQAALSLIIGQGLSAAGPVWTLFILSFAGFVLMIVKGLVYEHFLKAPKSRQSLFYGFMAAFVSSVVFSVALILYR